MNKADNLVMAIMLIIIIFGVVYSIYSDWSLLIENSLNGIGKICKDLIPLASIVFGYYLGKSSTKQSQQN